MAARKPAPVPWWSWLFPLLGWAAILLLPHGPAWTALGFGAVLVGTVFAAVHHAELVAHRVGEPFGTLVLALAVTVIEAALIVSLMLHDPAGKAALARDTVFAVVMIVCNGIIGLCLLLGGARHLLQPFRVEGTAALLAILAALSVLTLVLPNYTTSTPGPTYTRAQLVFVAVVSLVLYATFVFVQTVRHRDFFLPEEDDLEHAAPPSARAAWIAMGLLVLALVAVVLLAKALAPTLEAGVDAASLPAAVVGVAIAALVLLPEGLAAVRAARRNRLQTALNLALGSSLATIGLTIPVVAAVSLWLGVPLRLGLTPKETVLLWLTLLVSVLNLSTGRTTVLQGVVLLVIFATYLVLVVLP